MHSGCLRGSYFAGQWLTFADQNGKGFAQPDFYVLGEEGILLVECKLSQTDVAFSQMKYLYAPLLEHYYELPVTSVQVCKYLRKEGPGIVSGLDLVNATSGSTLHWIGN